MSSNFFRTAVSIKLSEYVVKITIITESACIIFLVVYVLIWLTYFMLDTFLPILSLSEPQSIFNEITIIFAYN